MKTSFRVHVPPIPFDSGAIEPIDETDGGTMSLTPAPPRPFSPATHNIGIPDVADQTLAEYLQVKPEPNQALLHARLDRIWLQVAREYQILDGDKKHDQLLWQDHQLFMQGVTVQDPLMFNSAARDEFLRRVMVMVGAEGQGQMQSKLGTAERLVRGKEEEEAEYGTGI